MVCFDVCGTERERERGREKLSRVAASVAAAPPLSGDAGACLDSRHTRNAGCLCVIVKAVCLPRWSDVAHAARIPDAFRVPGYCRICSCCGAELVRWSSSTLAHIMHIMCTNECGRATASHDVTSTRVAVCM
jgi:hypothetical protein